jgi:allantoicase
LPKVDLRPGFLNQSQHYFAVDYNKQQGTEAKWTHVRLKQYPDGGIARLKIYGKVLPNWKNYDAEKEHDLAFVGNGGLVVAVSDMYFSSKDNIIMPGRGVNMGDGWETKRSRVKGHVDWLIVKLGQPARRITKLEIDTAHFKGNYPESCTVEGANVPEGEDLSKGQEKFKWKTILGRTELSGHNQHYFDISTTEAGDVSDDYITHVKLTAVPDGGVSRFRVHGLIAKQ